MRIKEKGDDPPVFSADGRDLYFLVDMGEAVAFHTGERLGRNVLIVVGPRALPSV